MERRITILFCVIFFRLTNSALLESYFFRDSSYVDELPSVDVMWTKPGNRVLDCIVKCSHVPGCLSVVYGDMTCYGFAHRIHSGVPTTSHTNYMYLESKGRYGNLAENKQTDQKAVIASSLTLTPDKAVDGIRDPDILHDSCALIDKGVAIWWLVNLVENYTVTSVAILAQDSFSDQSESLVIEVGLPYVFCASVGVGDGWINSFRTFTCPVPLYGSIVKITKTVDHQYMCLCEVEVYGI